MEIIKKLYIVFTIFAFYITDFLHFRFLSEGELIDHQMAEQQQHIQMAQQATGSSTVISAGHLAAGENANSPQRNYYMWKDSLQPLQPGKAYLF